MWTSLTLASSVNLKGCRRTFKNFSTLRNHVYQRHDIQNIDSSIDHEREPDSDVDPILSHSEDENLDTDQPLDESGQLNVSTECKFVHLY